MPTLLAIFLGAGLGGLLRHLTVGAVVGATGQAFPYGTLTVNVVGAFVLGLIVSLWALHGEPSATARALVVTGLLGGFTTFSAFSLETVTLLERNQTGLAIAYITLSVAGSLLAMAAGLTLARHLG
ncbi:MAG: fluoride efflux transporter CrcB [Proteobacteria bacterium]|nr:fluoride efflux transporter CrcB [Pseudomonadota bacterium]